MYDHTLHPSISPAFLHQPLQPTHQFLSCTSSRNMVTLHPRNIDPLALSFSTFPTCFNVCYGRLLHRWGDAPVILTQKPAHRHILVPGIRQGTCKCCAGMLAHFLSLFQALLGRERVATDFGCGGGLGLKHPPVLTCQRRQAYSPTVPIFGRKIRETWSILTSSTSSGTCMPPIIVSASPFPTFGTTAVMYASRTTPPGFPCF